MSIIIAVKANETDYWHELKAGPIHLGERARVRVTLRAEHVVAGARLMVGDVPVASSQWEDRAEYHLRSFGYNQPQTTFTCMGKLFRDWIGETELRAEVLEGGHWNLLSVLGPIYVEPERMRPEEFALLCDAVAAQSADLLADVYGKTSLGHARGGASSSPPAVLARIRQVLDQLATALGEISRSPAYRLKTRRIREPALPGQAVSELTLEEACFDPSLVVAHNGGVRFREQVRETSSQNYRLDENQMLADFLAFLRQQTGDVRLGLKSEIIWREAQKAFRNRPPDDGGLSWWESEDKPRIAECQRLTRQAEMLERDVNKLARMPFLPPGAPLVELPPSTPLVRSHRAYGSAYRVAVNHFAGHQLRMDAGHLVTRARSVPVLYEWWCALEVIRVLRSLLRPVGGGEVGRRLASDPGRYVVDLTADQKLEFLDEVGRRVRLRYQPAYLPPGDGREFGLLGRGAVRTPDLAIEVFGGGDIPDLIIVLDAKYSSAPHPVKLDEVKLKYDRIGDFRNGRVLSRQVWALVPATPGRIITRSPDWAAACSVDNIGVFSDAFDIDSCVAGVIHTVPLTGPGKPPVEELIKHLLMRSSVRVAGLDETFAEDALAAPF